MIKRFRPAPPEVRCVGVVYRVGWEWAGGRCPQQRVRGSDLCTRHREMERAGQLVQRVRAPQIVGQLTP